MAGKLRYEKNMKEKIKYITGILVLAITLFTVSAINCLKPEAEFSESERRQLKTHPEWTLDSFLKNTYGNKFENAAMDQFPFRDEFRRIKSYTLYYLFREKDNNGIYIKNGYAAKLDYPLKEASVQHALDTFEAVYNTYLSGSSSKIYACIVPDKGYYLAKQNGYPAMDYDRLFAEVKDGMDYAAFVDIRSLLSIKDYYRTDTHWKQENIRQVAKKLGSEMGIGDLLTDQYKEIVSDKPFYGVYYGQSALPLKSETVKYLTNEVIEGCKVYNYETGKTTEVYETDKLSGRDPYEMFLSGAAPLLTIENPKAAEKKELIVFRDSFGSSLIPLLTEGYSKIIVVDIRYIKSSLLKDYIDFNNQDVLFLYSTLLLNDSYSLK